MNSENKVFSWTAEMFEKEKEFCSAISSVLALA